MRRWLTLKSWTRKSWTRKSWIRKSWTRNWWVGSVVVDSEVVDSEVGRGGHWEWGLGLDGPRHGEGRGFMLFSGDVACARRQVDAYTHSGKREVDTCKFTISGPHGDC